MELSELHFFWVKNLDYISLDSVPYYSDCAPVVESLGFFLVDLKVVVSRGNTSVSAVIASKDASVNIGVNDCAKVHRVLLPKLEELLNNDDVYMELTSPGMERNIKNPAEFAFFKGREIRVWSKEVSDWVSGILEESDEHSLTLQIAVPGDKTEKKIFSYADIAKAKFVHN